MSNKIVKNDLDISTVSVDNTTGEINEVLIRTYYDGLNVIMSNASAIDFKGQQSMTKQSFAAECDINNIMSQYEETGQLPLAPDVPLQFGDFTALPEYMDAQNLVAAASNHFSTLSSKVRSFFDNDPAQLYAFLDDPENAAEARTMGLLPPLEPVPNPGANPAAGGPQGPQEATGGTPAASA